MPSCFTVVLAGDYGYIRQIETTIKSICYHNVLVKFYVLNQDIPREWFLKLRKKMSLIGCDLIDVKLMDSNLNKSWTAGFPHINYMAFARYFIPKVVAEDKVLYLDSDLVVTGDITHLFDLDLRSYYGAAVPALHGMTRLFNSGVILINNRLWREDNLFDKLIETTNREWENVPEGDQSILNMVFSGNWLQLDRYYNFPIGYDLGASLKGQTAVFDIPINPLPLILHYISPDKPWNTYSSGRLRQVWWDYEGVEWSDIVSKQQVSFNQQVTLARTEKKCLIVTNSEHLEQIEFLVLSLPKCEFHICAYTAMGDSLLRLAQYENVVLHPKVMYQTIFTLIDEMDMYLDINHGIKFSDILDAVCAKSCPVFAFDNTCQTSHGQKVFSHTEPLDMVQSIYDTLDFNRK